MTKTNTKTQRYFSKARISNKYGIPTNYYRSRKFPSEFRTVYHGLVSYYFSLFLTFLTISHYFSLFLDFLTISFSLFLTFSVTPLAEREWWSLLDYVTWFLLTRSPRFLHMMSVFWNHNLDIRTSPLMECHSKYLLWHVPKKGGSQHYKSEYNKAANSKRLKWKQI